SRAGTASRGRSRSAAGRSIWRRSRRARARRSRPGSHGGAASRRGSFLVAAFLAGLVALGGLGGLGLRVGGLIVLVVLVVGLRLGPARRRLAARDERLVLLQPEHVVPHDQLARLESVLDLDALFTAVADRDLADVRGAAAADHDLVFTDERAAQRRR